MTVHPLTSPKISKNIIEEILIRNMVKAVSSGTGISKFWCLYDWLYNPKPLYDWLYNFVTSLNLSFLYTLVFPDIKWEVLLLPHRVVMKNKWDETCKALHGLPSTLYMYLYILSLLILGTNIQIIASSRDRLVQHLP